MRRPQGNLALVHSRESDIDITVEEDSQTFPQSKPCRFCGGELHLMQDGTRLEGNQEKSQFVYMDRLARLIVCARCNQGMARLHEDGRFKCVQCEMETSFGVQ